jgi:hemoglobin/transferrin/lactoferrin receptor protein
MKKIVGLALFMAWTGAALAQDSLSEKKLDEVIIYSGKFAEQQKNIVQKIDVISAQRIAQLNAQNTGDLLMNTGNVFVQKSQQGGSSPVIRGFEASRVLLVIDGIRMNNAIYRAGHLQNVITVDQNMLERVEVLYGPASTLYGSDALGGVVHLRTKQPTLSFTGRTAVNGTGFVRYSSANNEKTAHVDANIGGRKWAWLQAYNFSDFGDMKMGDRNPKDYPNFGRRTQYVGNINGNDTILTNSDDRVQKFSGYHQWDVTQKLLFQPGTNVSHSLNLQLSNTNNVPRYDRLQDVRNGTLRYAEWYYGPQLRTLAAYELNVKPANLFTEFRTNVHYQHIEESRHQREYKRYDRLDNRYEALDVWGFTVDGRKLWTRHELTVGVDGQLNKVQSTANRKNIKTGATVPLDTRYPDGDNNMNNFGVYAQHLMKLAGEKLIINDGVRLQFVNLQSTINNNSFFNFPFTSIEQNNTALTGNLGLVYMPVPYTRITAGLSTGFRTPNIDDLARIFESNTASRQLVVPNRDIKPEYTYNVDAGISQSFGGQLQVEVNGYYTLFRNAISLAPFQLNGQDSVLYNGVRSKVFANQNVSKAFLYGGHAAVSYTFAKAFKVLSTLNYSYGRLQSPGKTEVPLDHIPPVYGKTSLLYQHPRVQAELYALYNGWKKLKDYNPSGEDNAQYATADGTPSWYTINVKTSITVTQQLQLQLGVENLLDRNYRHFASGFSAPGRNFIVALRGRF